MNKQIHKYWMLVASKNHVTRGVEEGIAQACHGKAQPLNLMEVPGMNSLTALYLIGEIGLDMTRWQTAKQFASWLGLCPGNKVSGGKRLSGKSKPSANRAAATLRMAASTLYRNTTALGAYLRRLKSPLGPAKAITATA
jgi:transposase